MAKMYVIKNRDGGYRAAASSLYTERIERATLHARKQSAKAARNWSMGDTVVPVEVLVREVA